LDKVWIGAGRALSDFALQAVDLVIRFKPIGTRGVQARNPNLNVTSMYFWVWSETVSFPSTNIDQRTV
jgi:hypothetical protein